MGIKRGAPSALITAFSGHFHPVIMIAADWPDGTVYTHSGVGTLTHGGNDYSGNGGYVNLRLPDEGGGIIASDAMVSLAGTLEDIMAERGKTIRNLPFLAYIGATTTAGGTTLVSDPVDLFSGYYNSRSFTMRQDGEDFSHDLDLGLGSGPPARANASVTHSHEDQKTKFPGDTAGRHLQNMRKRAVNPPSWPEK